MCLKGAIKLRSPSDVGLSTDLLMLYNMPEVVVNALIEHGKLSPDQNPLILDLACGDGLCGNYLKVIVFSVLIA